jgi:hypothetical protein
MPITSTTNDVSMNPAHGEVYFIQHYVIKFVSELQQASTLGTLVSSTYKMDYHVLLKVALDTITLTIYIQIFSCYMSHDMIFQCKFDGYIIGIYRNFQNFFFKAIHCIMTFKTSCGRKARKDISNLLLNSQAGVWKP